jgi:hypothetical protein
MAWTTSPSSDGDDRSRAPGGAMAGGKGGLKHGLRGIKHDDDSSYMI